MKNYKKTHETKKALNSHIQKIKKRGGKYTVKNKTITYSFLDDKNISNNNNLLSFTNLAKLKSAHKDTKTNVSFHTSERDDINSGHIVKIIQVTYDDKDKLNYNRGRLSVKSYEYKQVSKGGKLDISLSSKKTIITDPRGNYKYGEIDTTIYEDGKISRSEKRNKEGKWTYKSLIR